MSKQAEFLIRQMAQITAAKPTAWKDLMNLVF